MPLTEKQAIIIGVGGLATLYLLKHKTSVKALTRAGAAKGSPAGTLSTAQRPSANLATQNARGTGPQLPSIVGYRTPPVATQAVSIAGALEKWFASVFKQPTAPKPAAPGAPPRSSAPTKSSGPSFGVGSGSGSGGGGGSRGSGQMPPGGNPWSPEGDYAGRSTVSGNYDPAQYYAIDPETGMPYEDAGPQQQSGGLDADGTNDYDDPPALEVADAGPQLPAGYDPETGTWEDAGPQLPPDNTFDPGYWAGADPDDPASDAGFAGPVDAAPETDAGGWEGGGDGSSWVDDQAWAE